jgi:hypothetical protein
VKTLRALLVGLALVGAAGACGDDDGDEAGDTTTTEAPTSTLSEAEEQAAVETVVTDYFRVLGEGNVDEAVTLLENGEEWRDEMVACSTLTTGVSVAVKTVELSDETNATATIDILGPEGNVLLADAGAGAVKVDGEWLVSSGTFQSLYDLAKDSCTGTTSST